MTQCRKICTSKKLTTYPVEGRKYNDLPKCSMCYVRVDWDGIRCPCCGTKLSHRKRRINPNVTRN